MAGCAGKGHAPAHLPGAAVQEEQPVGVGEAGGHEPGGGVGHEALGTVAERHRAPRGPLGRLGGASGLGRARQLRGAAAAREGGEGEGGRERGEGAAHGRIEAREGCATITPSWAARSGLSGAGRRAHAVPVPGRGARHPVATPSRYSGAPAPSEPTRSSLRSVAVSSPGTAEQSPAYSLAPDLVRDVFERAAFARLLRRLLARARGRRVLDLGCGDGLVAELAGERLDAYVGIDLYPPEGDGFVRHDLREGLGDVGAEPFDVYVGTFGVASHMAPDELRRLLSDIAAHARRGSLVALDALGLRSLEWPRVWDSPAGPRRTLTYRLAEDVRVHPWSPCELAALFEEAGLEFRLALDRSVQAGPKLGDGDYWPGLPRLREGLNGLLAGNPAGVEALRAPLPAAPRAPGLPRAPHARRHEGLHPAHGRVATAARRARERRLGARAALRGRRRPRHARGRPRRLATHPRGPASVPPLPRARRSRAPARPPARGVPPLPRARLRPAAPAGPPRPERSSRAPPALLASSRRLPD